MQAIRAGNHELSTRRVCRVYSRVDHLAGGINVRKEVVGGARNADLVRIQYEDFWSELLQYARRFVAEEPHNLARALNLCLAAYPSRPRKVRWLRGRRVASTIVGRPLPPRLSSRCLRMIIRGAVTDLIASYCASDTKRIIELGSGWGANLFNLWLAGTPRAAEYVALEYTEAGREATRLLASTEPDLRLQIQPFDYNDPDLSAYRSTDKTLVFSCHSIEQITTLGDAVFEELLAIPGLDRVVHIEPVGGQLLANSAAGPFLKAASLILPPRLSLEIDVLRRSRKTGYNANLVPKLRALETAKRIRIERIEKDYVGGNPLNPGTAIVWRRLTG